MASGNCSTTCIPTVVSPTFYDTLFRGGTIPLSQESRGGPCPRLMASFMGRPAPTRIGKPSLEPGVGADLSAQCEHPTAQVNSHICQFGFIPCSGNSKAWHDNCCIKTAYLHLMLHKFGGVCLTLRFNSNHDQSIQMFFTTISGD